MGIWRLFNACIRKRLKSKLAIEVVKYYEEFKPFEDLDQFKQNKIFHVLLTNHVA
jgi:hypothetical protein